MNHIIYHDNCVDGFGAAFIAARNFETLDQDYVMIPHSYGKPVDFMESLEADDHVFILDYSLPPEVMVSICEKVELVVWLDHHKSAIDKWTVATTIHTPEDLIDTTPANLKEVLDITRSGTGITFDYFHPVSVRPMWVNWIEDRDLWKFKYGEASKQFHAAISSYPKTVEQWHVLLVLGTQTDYEQLLTEGEAILRAHNQRVKEIADGCAVPIVIDGQKGFAANCNGYFASDVGHELAERSGTFGATWYQNASGDIKWSLRAASNNSVDVAKIAEAFGGGGHKAAAGFSLSNPATDCFNPTIQIWSSVERQTANELLDAADDTRSYEG